MQVLLNSDPHIEAGQPMAAHLESVVKDALGRFGGQVTRVEAHLTEAHSAVKANPNEIHCALEARLAGLEPVVVKDHAASAHQAIHGAVVKLKRAIATSLEKHESHRGAGKQGDAALDAKADLPV